MIYLQGFFYLIYASPFFIDLPKYLSEDLEGDFSIENSNGTIIKISFVHNAGIKRHDTLTSSFVSNN
jgi:hypothetical protein